MQSWSGNSIHLALLRCIHKQKVMHALAKTEQWSLIKFKFMQEESGKTCLKNSSFLTLIRIERLLKSKLSVEQGPIIFLILVNGPGYFDFVKNISQEQWDGSARKGTCCQVCSLQFDSTDSCKFPCDCHMHTLVYVCSSKSFTCTHKTNKLIKCNKNKNRKKLINSI